MGKGARKARSAQAGRPTRVSIADVVSYLGGGAANEDVVRCIDGLRANPNIWRLGDCGHLRLLAQRCELGEGAVVVDILVTFRGASSAEDGLIAVDGWLAHTDRMWTGCRHPRRPILLAYVTDAHVALGEWLIAWNRRADRWARRLVALDS